MCEIVGPDAGVGLPGWTIGGSGTVQFTSPVSWGGAVTLDSVSPVTFNTLTMTNALANLTATTFGQRVTINAGSLSGTLSGGIYSIAGASVNSQLTVTGGAVLSTGQLSGSSANFLSLQNCNVSSTFGLNTLSITGPGVGARATLFSGAGLRTITNPWIGWAGELQLAGPGAINFANGITITCCERVLLRTTEGASVAGAIVIPNSAKFEVSSLTLTVASGQQLNLTGLGSGTQFYMDNADQRIVVPTGSVLQISRLTVEAKSMVVGPGTVALENGAAISQTLRWNQTAATACTIRGPPAFASATIDGQSTPLPRLIDVYGTLTLNTLSGPIEIRSIRTYPGSTLSASSTSAVTISDGVIESVMNSQFPVVNFVLKNVQLTTAAVINSVSASQKFLFTLSNTRIPSGVAIGPGRVSFGTS